MLLFVCHANCARSVLASYLYRRLCPGRAVASAGLEAGAQTSDTALAMLAHWGIDARAHRPRQLRRRTCEQADAVFVMAAPYMRRLLEEYGRDLAGRAYLYRDPFARPDSFAGGSFTVADPSFDTQPLRVLIDEFEWMRERSAEIDAALNGRGRRLIPAARYLDLLGTVDPLGH